MKAVLMLLTISAMLFAQGNGLAGRDSEQIRSAADSLNDLINQSYELILEDVPDLAGEITVSFSITPDGNVTDAAVTCSEGLEAVEEAVLEEMNELSLPAAPDQTEAVPVSISFTLVPGD